MLSLILNFVGLGSVVELRLADVDVAHSGVNPQNFEIVTTKAGLNLVSSLCAIEMRKKHIGNQARAFDLLN